ncbi:uncharacterized protein LOC132195354 [Neocloeon triangulifer]|uniref:uncharacterized protein LOC132195354 n=1 Tax=Neocloeon triangulifer TaxID=2078957 RepID=UPI00286F6028|nr:uncharacterized protein LOC132195354 [Neocloeon triangulifer]
MIQVLLSILFFSVPYVLSAESGGTCGPAMFAGMDKCCLLPKLIPFESFNKCFPPVNTAKQEDASQKNGKNLKKSNKALEGDQMCLVQCAMNDLNLLDSGNNVNADSVYKRLLKVSLSHWNSYIIDAVENCSAEFNNLDLSGVAHQLDQDGKMCNPGPFLYLSCINGFLASDCPSQSRGVSLVDEKDECPGKMANLKKCSPFSILSGWTKKKSKVEVKPNARRNSKRQNGQSKKNSNKGSKNNQASKPTTA